MGKQSYEKWFSLNENQRNLLKCKIKLSFAVSITIAGCIAVNDTKSSAIPAEPPPLVAHILFMILSATASVSFFLTVNMSKALATIPVDKVIDIKYQQANALAPDINSFVSQISSLHGQMTPSVQTSAPALPKVNFPNVYSTWYS